MPSASGIDAQFGVAQEVTYGTYVAPTRFYEFTSESMKYTVQRIVSAGIRPGRRTRHRWKAGAKSVSGDIMTELAAQDLGLLMRHALGDPTTTGTDPYTHTFSNLKNIDDRSLTLQIGRPDEAGTVQPFSYLGCKITKWQIEAAINQFVKSTWSFYGREEVTAQALASATYDAELDPFVFTEANMSVAAGDIAVKSVSLSIDLGLATDRHRITATTGDKGKPKKALISNIAEITGTFTADFENLTQYNRYVNGTEATFVLNFDAGADRKLTLTMNTRFDGDTPSVPTQELLELSVPFVVTHATSDATAFSAVLVNSDATP